MAILRLSDQELLPASLRMTIILILPKFIEMALVPST
jgi:hypothetical protein